MLLQLMHAAGEICNYGENCPWMQVKCFVRANEQKTEDAEICEFRFLKAGLNRPKGSNIHWAFCRAVVYSKDPL